MGTLTRDTFSSQHYTWNDFKNDGVYGGDGQLDADAVKSLDDLTTKFGRKLTINSASRSPGYNAGVSFSKSSQHSHGDAFDIDVSGMSDTEKERLVGEAIKLGFRGIGAYDNGSIHLDTRKTSGKGPGGLAVWYNANDAYTNGPEWFRRAVDGNAGSSPAPAVSSPQWAAGSVQDKVYRAAKDTGVLDPQAVMAIVAQESGFKTDLRNPNSSAFGLFQQLQDERGAKGGIGESTDPDLQISAGIRKTLTNYQAAAAALGRAPTPGELYAVHYQGVGAGPAILKADKNKPLYDILAEGWGKAHADAVFKANPNFERDGIKTAGDFLNWSEAKMAQRIKELGMTPAVNASYTPSMLSKAPKYQASGEINMRQGPSAVSYGDLVPSDPVTPDDRIKMRIDAALQAEKDQYSALEGARRALANETATGWIFRTHQDYAPDPNFVPSRDLKEIAKDIPTAYLKNFELAVSAKHAEKIRDDILADMEYERKMEAMGWKGTGLKIGASILDPAGWLLAVAAGPAFGVGEKGSRVANALAGLMDGASTGVLQQAIITSQKPTDTVDSLIYAGLGGAIFGSAFGGALKPRIVPEIQDAIRAAAKPAMEDIEAKASEAGSAGAANAGTAGGLRNPVKMEAEDWMTAGDRDGSWIDRAMDKLRFSFAGKFLSSENPLTRAIGNVLVDDAVGNKKGGNTFAVSMEQKLVDLQATTPVYQAYKSSWDAFAERNGFSYVKKNFGDEEAKFRAQITDYITNKDPMLVFDKEVAQVGEAIREMHKKYVELANNPGLRDGTVRRSITGFEDISNFDWQHYIMRKASHHKMNDFIARFGDNAGINLIKEAIIDARLSNGKQLDQRITQKVAETWWKTQRDLMANQRLDMARAWSMQDRGKLVDLLKNEAGLSDDDIRQFLDDLVADKKDPSGTARGKDRVFMNENYAARMADGSVVRVRDLLEDDALMLATHYSRQMSGQIAFARMRVKNPEFGKGGPTSADEWLVDGLATDTEWTNFLKTHQAVWDLVRPDNKAKAMSELKDLEFVRRHIMGIPQEEEGGNLALSLRMLRDYNFVRAMNQVGFAQVAELGNTLGYAGVRAFIDGMPSFKSLWRDARTGKLNDELAQELEYITAAGTDVLRHSVNPRLDEFGSMFDATGSSKIVRGLDDALQYGKKVTQTISLMGPVNTYLQRWASRAMAAKFVNAAKLGKEISEHRLMDMGIDKKMARRIYDQINTHAKFTSATESGRTLRILDLENWTDMKARASFENALFRTSRQIIQENDIGQINRFIGGPLGKVLFQFRSFMLAAWEKQFLHGIAMRDWNTVSMFTATTLLGGLGYIGQTYLQSIGRGDRDEFLEKRLDSARIGAAAFQRAAWSSLIPMAVDNSLKVLSMDPVFDTRASGLPSQGLISNPTLNIVDNAYTFARGVTGAMAGDDFTQREARAGASLWFFQNFMPIQWTLNAMIADLPTRDDSGAK